MTDGAATGGAARRAARRPGGGAARAGVAGAGPVGPADRPPERRAVSPTGPARPRSTAARRARCARRSPTCAASVPRPWPQVARHAAGLLAALRVALAQEGAGEAERPPRQPDASSSASRSSGCRRADRRRRRRRHPRARRGRRRRGRDHRHRPDLDPAQRGGARGRGRGRRRGARAAARRRRRRAGTGRVRHAGPARRPVRPAPGVARRARGRPDHGPAGPARRRRARRERRGAGRAAVRRGRRARRRWCSSRSAPASAPRCCSTASSTAVPSGWRPSWGTSGSCRTGGPCPCGKDGCWERYCSGHRRWRPPPSSCWPATTCTPRCSAGSPRATPAR